MMDSMVYTRQHSFSNDTSSDRRNEDDDPSSGYNNYYQSESIPTWKMPLSKSFTSTLYSGDDQKHQISPVDEESSGRVSAELNSQDVEEDSLIQILLPCIICNRTFSPAALERHSKVCTKVNVPDKRQPRPTYDSHAQRIKNTRVADFIPPPEPPPENDWFNRTSRFRRSLTTRESFGKGSTPSRTRAASTPKTLHFDTSDTFGANSSDFGSSEDSGHNENENRRNERNLPAYARALSPAENCPYCLRSFGLKAYDRHVSFCREVWERKQFEIQPTPKELEEARERQEIRTKYKPMKGSTSCTSLRSTSPPKDPYTNFAAAALNKLFGGLRRTEGASNLFTRNNFKKSNDSLSSSCYGDFTRTMSLRRHPSTSPGMRSNIPTKLPSPMRLNTSVNLPSKTMSTESLTRANNHAPSSGYGPGGSYMSNFSRNSKMRASLGKNFFRSKRVEPEGHENTPSSHAPPLIITPMNFYNKSSYNNRNNLNTSDPGSDNSNETSKKSTLLSSDPKYDPYEKAAKQLEELLRTQPPTHHPRQNTQRKVGVDRALASVLGGSEKPNRTHQRLYAGDVEPEFNFDVNIETDDSYWDEIVGKKSRSKETGSTGIEHRYSDSSMDTQQARGASNVSSADSAFSRSDGGTDLEFEALESLMSVGSVPIGRSAREPGNKTSSASASLTSQTQPLPSIRRQSSQDPLELKNSSRNEKPASEGLFARLTKASEQSSEEMKQEGSGGSFTPGYAKFCHECGTSYPTAAAKFCPECGERRVVNV